METLPLCWVVEYACAREKDEVVQVLLDNFVKVLQDKKSCEDLSVKNAKGRFIIRTLLGVMKNEEFPKLKKEHELFCELLREYGSAGSAIESIKMVVAVQKQTYMHYISKINSKGGSSVEEMKANFERVKKFHKVMRQRIIARKRMIAETVMREGVDSQTNHIEKLILKKETRLYNDMSHFIDKFEAETHRSLRYLSDFCKDYSYDSFKNKFMKHLRETNEKLPMTVLEYFNDVWKQRKEIGENGITRKCLNRIYEGSPRKLVSIHQGRYTAVRKFIEENDVSDIFELPPNQTEVAEREILHVDERSLPENNADSRARVSSLKSLPLPETHTSDAQGPNSFTDPLHDLLELSDEDEAVAESQAPLTQEEPQTPIVASELRESIRNLQELRGSDPLPRAQQEGQRAQKRSRPTNLNSSPSSKVRRVSDNRSVPDIESSDEEVEEPNFRDAVPIADLHQPEENTNENVPMHTANIPKLGKARRARWTEEEVNMLVEGLRLFGVGKWVEILNSFPFEGRTNVNLKDKYRNLLKHYTEEEILTLPNLH